MSALSRYALTSLLVVILGIAILWTFLDDAGQRGVLLAALIACPVQVLAFGLLARAREDAGRFFIWWGAGIALRIAVVAVVGIASSSLESDGRTALVLSLVGFFFVLLLLEPVFLRGDRKDQRTAT